MLKNIICIAIDIAFACPMIQFGATGRTFPIPSVKWDLQQPHIATPTGMLNNTVLLAAAY